MSPCMEGILRVSKIILVIGSLYFVKSNVICLMSHGLSTQTSGFL